MASSFTGDFARLVPRNHVAQVLFSGTVVYVDKNDRFHLRFIDRTGGKSFPASSEPVEDSTEYETYPDTDAEDARFKPVSPSGHFVLSFDTTRGPEIPHLGWRVGKGSSKSPAYRGVDLLLAKPGDISSKSLASVHLLFRFNLRSGFLMLRGGSSKAAVEFQMGGMWGSLGYGEEHVLHQPATLLRAGACEYELEYTVEEKHRERYFEQRDAFLENISPSKDLLQLAFRKMPGDKCVLRGRYLEFETQGSGAFGWVTRAVDIKTGDPIAIKELRITSRRSSLEIMAEVKMGKRFLDKRGLFPIVDAQCEHGKPDSCCDLEKFYIFMPHAPSDLSRNFWALSEIPHRTKLSWLREILEGIGTLHAMGIMHRDIRPQNMLMVSMKPARASLCDYGKAIEAATSTVTTIGPISTLAPEVWTVATDGPYTAKIDMWAYGYAIAEILGYTVAKHPGRDGNRSHNPQITRHRHAAVLKMLRDHGAEVSEDGALADLASKLLVWKAEERWSAAQALQHVCWDPVTQEQGQVQEEEGEKKRDGEGAAAAEGRPRHAKRTRLEDPSAQFGG